MYYMGQGVIKNNVIAYMWYSICTSQSMPSEEFGRRENIQRDIVGSDMTPAQIAEAERLAKEWKPKKEGK